VHRDDRHRVVVALQAQLRVILSPTPMVARSRPAKERFGRSSAAARLFLEEFDEVARVGHPPFAIG
jgi:hypothetical protein